MAKSLNALLNMKAYIVKVLYNSSNTVWYHIESFYNSAARLKGSFHVRIFFVNWRELGRICP
jgi:hypothetical protein